MLCACMHRDAPLTSACASTLRRLDSWRRCDLLWRKPARRSAPRCCMLLLPKTTCSASPTWSRTWCVWHDCLRMSRRGRVLVITHSLSLLFTRVSRERGSCFHYRHLRSCCDDLHAHMHEQELRWRISMVANPCSQGVKVEPIIAGIACSRGALRCLQCVT